MTINNINIGDNFLNSDGERYILTDIDTEMNLYKFENMHGQWTKSGPRSLSNYTATDNIYSLDMLNEYKGVTHNIDKMTETIQKQIEYIIENPNNTKEINNIFKNNSKVDDMLNQYQSILAKIQEVDADFTPTEKTAKNFVELQESHKNFAAIKEEFFQKNTQDYSKETKSNKNILKNTTNLDIEDLPDNISTKEWEKYLFGNNANFNRNDGTVENYWIQRDLDLLQEELEQEKKLERQQIEKEQNQIAASDQKWEHQQKESIQEEIDKAHRQAIEENNRRNTVNETWKDREQTTLQKEMEQAHGHALEENKRRDTVDKTWEERKQAVLQEEIDKAHAQAIEENNRRSIVDETWAEREKNMESKSVATGETARVKPGNTASYISDDIEREAIQRMRNAESIMNYHMNKGPQPIERIEKWNNELVQANVEYKNIQNLKEYEKKRAEWEKNNPEASAKLEARREARKAGEEVVEKAAGNTIEESAEEVAKNLKKSTMRNLGHVMNVGFSIVDYKDSREAGKSVGSSLLHAGVELAKGEMLGFWGYAAIGLAKAAPSMVISAAEGLNTMTRSMNSTQRRQLFGDAQFMDTQQLATMRQSGMELAKMSQYNLQQTLMGNEAEYLHRL